MHVVAHSPFNEVSDGLESQWIGSHPPIDHALARFSTLHDDPRSSPTIAAISATDAPVITIDYDPLNEGIPQRGGITGT